MNLAKTLSLVISLTSVMVVPLYKANAASVQTPISRSQVEQRANNLMNLTWRYSVSKNGNIDPKYAASVTLPKQFQGITTGTFIGIPYAWGGIDGIDTASYNTSWTSFFDAVNKGAFTGNVNAKAGLGYVTGTAGMDCSGFVQASFNISDYKQSTTALLNNYFTPIGINSLRHMDILDKLGSHVSIFDRWGTLNGVCGAFTYESTPDQTYGGIQGTKRYFLSMNTINSGYIPARYKYIIEDTTTLTPKFKIGGYAQVSNVINYANLRANTGTNYTILTTIPKGTVLNLMSYSNGWYNITYNDQTGWISETVLGQVPLNTYVKINGVYHLNIRANPSSIAQILGIISKGQYAQKIEETSDGSWYKLSINGIQGWSYSKYLIYIQ
ncbi:SH3 domain-containing protein [Clostridium sp. JN-1]|uniref:SH3 domain-containing protein n=1 Tax=Clostridium sp. JN-1 TaxID=2483110 RepID=UPI00167FF2AB|nr:SH3 domain-containing protein [Clostridium sp. JN-1]